MKPMTVARVVLSLALLYGVYTETGPWTTLALGLGMFATELLSFALRDLLAEIRHLTGPRP